MYIRDYSSRGSIFFPLREVPILKMDAIDENWHSFQLSPFEMCNYFSVLAMQRSGYAIDLG